MEVEASVFEGSFSAQGIGQLSDNDLLSSFSNYGWVFQYDNQLKHTARTNKE